MKEIAREMNILKNFQELPKVEPSQESYGQRDDQMLIEKHGSFGKKRKVSSDFATGFSSIGVESSIKPDDIVEEPRSPKEGCMTISSLSQLECLPPRLAILFIENSFYLTTLPERVIQDVSEKPYPPYLDLVNCHDLESFYGGHPPTAVKSLSIRDCGKLEFLSPKSAKFKNSLLESLSIVNSCDSLTCLPLDCFPKLESLTISNCANFVFIMGEKGQMSLSSLQIRACPKVLSFPERGLCTPMLESVVLSNCKNLRSLSDQLRRLNSLHSLRIEECSELESIPKGGFPCNLSELRITNCNKLTPRTEWEMVKLNNLSHFEIEGGCNGLVSFPEENLLPSCLTYLGISKLPHLHHLDGKGLEKMTSLQTLNIRSCNWLKFMHEMGFPWSLTSLYIKDCPAVKSECKWVVLDKKYFGRTGNMRHFQIDADVIYRPWWVR